MKILKFDKQVASVEFSKLEIKVFINSITEVLESLHKSEFHTRMGVTVEQVEDFLVTVVQWSEPEDQIICLDLLRKQVVVLNNSLNEVCHGIRVDNFQSKIGSKEEVKNLLDAINKLMNEMK